MSLFSTYSEVGIIPGVVTTSDRRPEFKQWDMDRKVFEQSIHQRAPLNMFLDKIGSQETTTKLFYWSDMPFQGWRGTVLDVYTNSALSSAYSSGGVVGSNLFFAVTAADAKKIRQGDVVIVIDSNGVQRPVDVVASVVGDDSTSYFYAKLMVADTGNALAGATPTWRLASNSSEENSGLPDGISLEPRLMENCTQICKEAMEISGTELAEREKIDPGFKKRQQRMTFNRWLIGRERAFIFNPYKKDGVGPTGKEKRFTCGIYHAMKTWAPSNFFNFKTDAAYDAKTWVAADGGIKFLFEKLEILSRTSETKRMPAFIGSQGYLAINEAVRRNGNYDISETTNEYGFVVKRLIGLNLTLDFIQHPLFIDDPAFRKSMLVFEPQNLKERPLTGRAMGYVDDKNKDGHDWVDGIKEGWFSESGLQWNNLDCFGWFDDLGEDNPA